MESTNVLRYMKEISMTTLMYHVRMYYSIDAQCHSMSVWMIEAFNSIYKFIFYDVMSLGFYVFSVINTHRAEVG